MKAGSLCPVRLALGLCRQLSWATKQKNRWASAHPAWPRLAQPHPAPPHPTPPHPTPWHPNPSLVTGCLGISCNSQNHHNHLGSTFCHGQFTIRSNTVVELTLDAKTQEGSAVKGGFAQQVLAPLSNCLHAVLPSVHISCAVA